MYSSGELPWLKIHNFLLTIGNIRESREFCVQAIKHIDYLIPYDQARIYFVNDIGDIYDEVLFGVEKAWSDTYVNYYSKKENFRYSIKHRCYLFQTKKEKGYVPFPRLKGSVFDWTNYECESEEFAKEYVHPQRIKYSAGFGFHSANNFLKSVYMLDRTSRTGFNDIEVETMCIVQSHLNNLFKNLYVHAQSDRCNYKSSAWNMLTNRESEIAELLCRGFTPALISRQLFISVPTVYKHIANIHEKLNVSNRQELFLKLMDPPQPEE